MSPSGLFARFTHTVAAEPDETGALVSTEVMTGGVSVTVTKVEVVPPIPLGSSSRTEAAMVYVPLSG